MDAVQTLVAQIQSLQDQSHIHNLLKQAEVTLQSVASHLAPILPLLDPSTHSLAHLYVLNVFTSKPVSKDHVSDVIQLTVQFINACVPEHIRLDPEKFISVCKHLKEHVLLLKDPMQGVAPMLTACRKLQSSNEHLTALHPEFLLLCILAKRYKTGIHILMDDIILIDQPRDFSLFCYYGGMICIGQKRFQKALELLHNVVTAPMTVLNAIAVEAYKKYILVSLIHSGQFSSNFPKYASASAQRFLKNFTQPYIDLATNYSTGKVSDLERHIQINQATFESDSNLGLVKQVVSSMYKRNIQRLTQMYLTLSLEDIANTVQLRNHKEAEMHVLQMIQDGEIYATINQKDGMVRFLEDPEQYKTCEMVEHIYSSIQRMMTVSKKLTAMDESLCCDPLFLTKGGGRERQRIELDDFDNVAPRFM